jgi:hypothetical protein
MITPLVSMTRQSHQFIGCSALLDARCSLSRFSDTSSIAATDARYRLRTHGALGSTNRRTKIRSFVCARLRVSVSSGVCAVVILFNIEPGVTRDSQGVLLAPQS